MIHQHGKVMNRQTQKQKKQTKSSRPQQIGQIMTGLADNPEFILYNILKAKKA